MYVDLCSNYINRGIIVLKSHIKLGVWWRNQLNSLSLIDLIVDPERSLLASLDNYWPPIPWGHNSSIVIENS